MSTPGKPPATSEKDQRAKREAAAADLAKRASLCYNQQNEASTGDMTLFGVIVAIEDNAREMIFSWSSYSRAEVRRTAEVEITIYFNGSDNFRVIITIEARTISALGAEFAETLLEGIRSGTVRKISDCEKEDFGVRIEEGVTDEDGKMDWSAW